ncbi:MAG: hypothetical protein A2X17_06755 [Bacteroidetes bacterium GWF2_41_61]|nr:MAG: hypothetical protein A2X20_03035 [Bacteroidetes bacterium GWE2_40_15]OFY36986.1 MAG: hypothetical protein A2X17_06755 [Bacteroidetes bacterium GWF2_41_61]OFY91115.1 MAG: hypothetical protein A2266_01485 [Bacteroidetes bacterium RIFOXYA12_FULL_40_10]HBG24654.1 hypothetical protein [Rikenellaceae bacterium]HBZ25239.1 hypothetical protein [Rikenellaceae bacterium]
MRTVKFFLILMTAIMVVTGCDWIRVQLGMATSQDIAAMKKERQYDDSVRLMNDSVAISGNAGEMSTTEGKKMVITDTSAFNEQKKESNVAATNQPQQKNQPEQAVSAPAKTSLTNRYYVIIGSFKDHSNSAKMAEYLKSKGFTPTIMDFKNGFRVVSTSSYSTLGQAFNEMYKLRDQNFGPDDIWVYDVRQNMHN